MKQQLETHVMILIHALQAMSVVLVYVFREKVSVSVKMTANVLMEIYALRKAV